MEEQENPMVVEPPDQVVTKEIEQEPVKVSPPGRQVQGKFLEPTIFQAVSAYLDSKTHREVSNLMRALEAAPVVTVTFIDEPKVNKG